MAAASKSYSSAAGRTTGVSSVACGTDARKSFYQRDRGEQTQRALRTVFIKKDRKENATVKIAGQNSRAQSELTEAGSKLWKTDPESTL
jgi:hypothetical protein